MRRNCRGWAGALLGAWALSLAPGATLAENAAPTAAANADAQKSAFLALPEADRKAIQDALGWLGLYNGAVDGAWGKRTRDSILAYQAGASAPADGLVTAAQLAALKTAARKARAAVGFEILDERRSGVRIGAPLKMLTKIALVGGDATLSTPDGAVALAMQIRAGDQANLATLYGRFSAETGARKVTYKAIKADEFFVVAGEDGPRKFYARFAKSPADWADGPSLRGFTFAYPKDQAGDLDKVALAIANSFEPFSDAPTSLDTAAARGSSAPLTWRDIVKQGSESAGSAASPNAPAVAKPSPSAAETLATGLIVGPGQALTAAGPECANATVDGKPAKTLRADAASGLLLLAGEFAPEGAPPTYGALAADLVVLSFASGAPGKTTLEASAAVLAPGEPPQAVVAALGKGASGAPVFDRKGDVVALVGPVRGEPARVGGVPLAGPHAAIAADAIARFVGQPAAPASAQGPDLSAGDIARQKRAAVAPVVCRP